MATQEPSPPSSMESNKPGFPKKILANKLEDKHLCNCCHNILRRPFQAQCGHRFCSYCFNRTVRYLRSKACVCVFVCMRACLYVIINIVISNLFLYKTGFRWNTNCSYFNSNGPQKCNACIKEDIFEEPTSILKQGCVRIFSTIVSMLYLQIYCLPFMYIYIKMSNHTALVDGQWTVTNSLSIICVHLSLFVCLFVCLLRHFLTMQLEERWRRLLLFAFMKVAHGRAASKNMRYLIPSVRSSLLPTLIVNLLIELGSIYFIVFICKTFHLLYRLFNM